MATYTPNYNLYKPAGTDQFDNFLTEFGNNMDVIDSNLGGGGGSSTLAGLSDVNLTSPTTDDALIYDGAEWVNSPLSAVAFSGDYTDLSNAPTIPTKTSDLNNDSDFVSDSAYVHTDNNFTNADATKLSGIQAGAEVNVQSDWNEADNTADDYIKNKPTIPTNTSDLNNDSGFLDSSDITVTQVQTTGTKIATIDVDGNSTDLYAPTGGGSKHTIVNESGTALADEPNLQFTDGLKATDDSGNNKTKVGVDTTFTEASTRANINSGDTFSTILGKIKKWFTDLPSMFVSKSGDTMSGNLYIDRPNKSSNLVLGGVNSYGQLDMFSYGSNGQFVTVLPTNGMTEHKEIRYPNASGTLALVPTITKIFDNIYISTADQWVGLMNPTVNLNDYEYLGFSFCEADSSSEQSKIQVLIKVVDFKNTTQSYPLVVVDYPWNGGNEWKLRVAWSGQDGLDVYRGNQVYPFKRLVCIGIKF